MSRRCLVVIDNLDLVRVAVSPLEADPPLVVDSNTVLARAISGQPFQPVAWREFTHKVCR